MEKTDEIVRGIGGKVGVPAWGMYAIGIGTYLYLINWRDEILGKISITCEYILPPRNRSTDPRSVFPLHPSLFSQTEDKGRQERDEGGGGPQICSVVGECV